MKKRLFLLPLLGGFLLASCEINLFGKTIKIGGDTSSSETDKKSSGDDDSGSKDSGDTTPFNGLEMSPASLDALTADSEARGYAKLAEVEEIDGIPVSFESVMTNGLNSSSIPEWETPNDVKEQVIQMRKGEGVISVTGKISKVTVKLYSSYDWSSTRVPVIKFNGKTIAKPSSPKSKVSSGCKNVIRDEKTKEVKNKYDLDVYTIEYNVNGSTVEELRIENSVANATYLQSISLE